MLGLPAGIYCSKCIEEGRPERLPYDSDDYEYYGITDTPILATDSGTFSISEVWPMVEQTLGSRIIYVQDIPGSPADHGSGADLDYQLNSDLWTLLRRRKDLRARNLYRHQHIAIREILTGRDVVISTSTASGKSLCYVLPILHRLIKEPGTKVLYLSPLNALSSDQLDMWSSFDESGTDWSDVGDSFYAYCRQLKVCRQKICVARYDGNVPNDFRGDIRARHPDIVITNPEMLHRSLLTHNDLWKDLFSRLRYVILDELHEYRGIFGANLANLIRRLTRVCYYLGSAPQFIGCSATIMNPRELFLALTGRDPVVIGGDIDGSPRRPKRVAIVTSDDEASFLTVAKDAIATLVARGRTRTIAFCRSINMVNAMFNLVRLQIKDLLHVDVDMVKEFRRALPANEKRRITADLKEGKLVGVITTSALELGIDIGDLSAAVIVGFPGKISSVMQQAGRAGRRGEGIVLLLASEDPLNQFFVQHPEEFFAMDPEDVWVDPDNHIVVLDHLWCAAADRPIDPQEDQRFFGDSLPALLENLGKMDKLCRDAGRDVFVLKDQTGFPAGEVDIRAFGFDLPVMCQEQEILREDARRAPRFLHKYARVQVQEHLYQITELSLDITRKKGLARARKVGDRDFTTQSVEESSSSIVRERLSRTACGVGVHYGDVEFESQVKGYYRVPYNPTKGEKPKYQPLGPASPPGQAFDTAAVWFTVPPDLCREFDGTSLDAGMRSMARALALATCITLKCDRADVNGLSAVAHPDTGSPTIFVHDTSPGGSGLSEKVYYNLENIFRRAYLILRDCPYCSTHAESKGCPRCVTEAWNSVELIDRSVAISLLESILRRTRESIPGA
jgi:DEAD/DEAH box helicase domain-containing protein